ncbi:unnamed protein product [Paramecium sonneborni]|uniref:Uncharacterized protein n=1 Tax=Paramecium sonneborni TaxID=65129 RepID=A0A8S1MBT1_9CILI|nr:unnamed protein product [Paramecium sonneborni]
MKLFQLLNMIFFDIIFGMEMLVVDFQMSKSIIITAKTLIFKTIFLMIVCSPKYFP